MTPTGEGAARERGAHSPTDLATRLRETTQRHERVAECADCLDIRRLNFMGLCDPCVTRLADAIESGELDYYPNERSEWR